MILRTDHGKKERRHPVIVPDPVPWLPFVGEKFSPNPVPFRERNIPQPGKMARPHGSNGLQEFRGFEKLGHTGQKPARRPTVNHPVVKTQG